MALSGIPTQNRPCEIAPLLCMGYIATSVNAVVAKGEEGSPEASEAGKHASGADACPVPA